MVVFPVDVNLWQSEECLSCSMWPDGLPKHTDKSTVCVSSMHLMSLADEPWLRGSRIISFFTNEMTWCYAAVTNHTWWISLVISPISCNEINCSGLDHASSPLPNQLCVRLSLDHATRHLCATPTLTRIYKMLRSLDILLISTMWPVIGVYTNEPVSENLIMLQAVLCVQGDQLVIVPIIGFFTNELSYSRLIGLVTSQVTDYFVPWWTPVEWGALSWCQCG
jgi:hypothetical protein